MSPVDYAAIVKRVKSRHRIRVHKWRRNMSGCAWQVRYPDGTSIKWVESPIPKTPLSLSIFLHEVGHHVIGFERYKRRCEEEYHVWEWAIAEMSRLGIEPDEKVQSRFERSMQYAVGKALRRGIKELPTALMKFSPKAA
jgi:hypothetical protein